MPSMYRWWCEEGEGSDGKQQVARRRYLAGESAGSSCQELGDGGAFRVLLCGSGRMGGETGSSMSDAGACPRGTVVMHHAVPLMQASASVRLQ